MNAHQRNWLLGLPLAVLAACATPTSYREYQVSVPAQYAHSNTAMRASEPTAGAGAPPGESASVRVAITGNSLAPAADTGPGNDVRANPWSKTFADARLDRLIETVLRVNSDLVAAGLRVQRARLLAGLAEYASGPQFDGNLSSSATEPLTGNAANQRSSSVRVAVNYEIDLWGKLSAQRAVAEWQARASTQDLQSTAMLLIADTCSLYWTLGALNWRITQGSASLTQVARTLTLVQAQFAAGAVSRVEVREAEQQLYRQQAAQSLLRQSRVQTRNALGLLLDGQSWPQDAEPPNLEGAHSQAPAAGLPAQLLGRRPDLRAAQLRLRAASASVELARSSYYPALSLTGALGSSSASLLDVLQNPVATLGAGLTLPFLHWQELRLNTALARVDHALAINDFRKLLYGALAEVDNALSARSELLLQLAALDAARAAAVQLEVLYEVRYRAGAAPLRIWLDAQESRRNADLALTDARLRLLQNDATLYLALGGASGASL